MTESISDVDSRIQSLTQDLSHCVALVEQAAHELKSHDVITGRRIEASEAYFEAQMKGINRSIADLQEFMTQTGAARFRVSAEKAVKEGEMHVIAIKRATEEFRRVSEASCKRIETVAESAKEMIFEAVDSLQIQDFRRATLENTHRVEQVSNHAVNKIRHMVKWFHWEKLGLAAAIAVSVSLMTALFVNDESPVESHKHVVAERQAGKMLMKVWPKLSAQDKDHFQHAASGIA